MSPQTKRMRITVEGKAYDVTVELLDEAPAKAAAPLQTPAPRAEAPAAPAAPTASTPRPAPARVAGAVPSPLSGVVVSLDVTVGQAVQPGDLLVTLEAMKMKTPVRAPSGGTVKSIEARVGAAIEEGAPLVVLG